MLEKYKTIIIVLILLVLGFVGFYFLKSDMVTQESSLKNSEQRNVDILGQDIIRVLDKIDSIDLDRNIFDDPVYKRLTDYSRVIEDQPVGERGNIFSVYSTSPNPDPVSN